MFMFLGDTSPFLAACLILNFSRNSADPIESDGGRSQEAATYAEKGSCIDDVYLSYHGRGVSERPLLA